MTQRTNLAESENAQAQRDADELRKKYTDLRQQSDKLVTDMMNKMPIDEHINALAALKQLVVIL